MKPACCLGDQSDAPRGGGFLLPWMTMIDGPSRPPTFAELRGRRSDILRVAAAHRVSNVRVFGSVARGDADARDVDFVVDLPDDARGFHAFGILDELRQDLEAMVGCKVDVVTIRGPFSPKGAVIAERIEREALEL